jgi:hypothetical protein
MKINSVFINVLFILSSCVLIISLSKEVIIHSSSIISYYTSLINILGMIGTMIYSLKIYSFLFNANGSIFSNVNHSYSSYISNSSYSFSYFSSNLSYNISNHASFLLPCLTISSIFIDQSFSYFFSLSCSGLFYIIDYSFLHAVNIVLDFSLVFFIFIISIFLFNSLSLISSSSLLSSSSLSSFSIPSFSSFSIPSFSIYSSYLSFYSFFYIPSSSIYSYSSSFYVSSSSLVSYYTSFYSIDTLKLIMNYSSFFQSSFYL